ncbi:C40 family peptidase [Caldisericum exile]|uniref:Peptidase C40 family protein n=1 Tax=Caldisericum exile (strain DSM 21853 / NBRC 104410 / AZM16c01) TaxID=511051 RepID=A0A7U6GDI4_CALEA|nr:SH3 domain-containing C40 family peptidase [Caldisericum exile]BAL80415.1 peptidase C40 family protein [Caldisericum exile AZM16c01]
MEKYYVVNVPFSNMYKDVDDMEVVSQVLMGERIVVLDFFKDFVRIKAEDGYTGFVKKDIFVDFEILGMPAVVIIEKVAFGYEKPSVKSRVIYSLPIGSVLYDKGIIEGDYRIVENFSGTKFYIHKNTITTKKFPFEYEKKNCKEILKTALMFLNVPYFWGGKTPFGFDCSGFIQTVFKLNGYKLPRDAYMQAESNVLQTFQLSSIELSPCDLLFFGKNKIDHVGLYMGNKKFIHATTFNVPKVQITNFDEYWIEKLNSVGRIKW